MGSPQPTTTKPTTTTIRGGAGASLRRGFLIGMAWGLFIIFGTGLWNDLPFVSPTMQMTAYSVFVLFFSSVSALIVLMIDRYVRKLDTVASQLR